MLILKFTTWFTRYFLGAMLNYYVTRKNSNLWHFDVRKRSSCVKTAVRIMGVNPFKGVLQKKKSKELFVVNSTPDRSAKFGIFLDFIACLNRIINHTYVI